MVTFNTATETINNRTDGFVVRLCVPCDRSCPPQVSAGGGILSPLNYLTYERTITGLCTTADYDISILYDAWNNIGNSFFLQANGVTIWNTGCVLGSGTSTVTIPAGTTTLYFGVIAACNTPGDDLWTLSVSCV